MENQNIKLRLSVGIEFRAQPSSKAQVRMVRPAGTTLTIVRDADGWFLARDEQGLEGWFRAEQDPTLHTILKRAARNYPASFVNKLALDHLDHVVVGVWANRKDMPEARERLQTLVEGVGVLHELSRDAQGYLTGDPNAEARFFSLVENLTYQKDSPKPDENPPAHVTPVWLPTCPDPPFPSWSPSRCFFDSFANGRLFEGLMFFARRVGDEINQSPEEIYNGLVQRLKLPLAAAKRLEILYAVGLAVNPGDQKSIARFERWFAFLTAQSISLGDPSADKDSLPLTLPGLNDPFFRFDLCRLDLNEGTVRAVRCLCHDAYRVTRIVDLERPRVDGGELVSEGCHGDLIEIQGTGFGDSRDWGLGGLQSEVIYSGPTALGVPVGDGDYGSWSDTSVQVRVPGGAASGIISMRILCRDVDLGECGVQLKLAGGLLSSRMFTIPEVPTVSDFTGGSTRWGEDFAIHLRVLEAESVVVRDEDNEVFFPEGAPGPRRTVEGAVIVNEVVGQTYTLAARNACHEATATTRVTRRREFALLSSGDRPSGESLTITLLHYCSPERLGLSEAVFILTLHDPDAVLLDTPDRIVVTGSNTETTVSLRTRPGACGRVLATATPEDASTYDTAASSTGFFVIGVPVITQVRAVSASVCDVSRFEVTGDCLALDPSRLEVHLTETPSGRPLPGFVRVIEVVPGSEHPSHGARIICETTGGLGRQTYTVSVALFGRTSNEFPLLDRPLSSPFVSVHSFNSSRTMIRSGDGLHDTALSWEVRYAEHVEIWASGGRLGRGEGVIHTHPAPTRDFCETWSGTFHDRIEFPLFYELRAYGFEFPAGGMETRRVAVIETAVPPTMPMLRGIRRLRIWNCDVDRHRVNIWTRKLAPIPEDWFEWGALDSRYDGFGSCPFAESESLDLTFEDGAIYELQIVDPNMLTCMGRNDPRLLNCQRLGGREPGRGGFILGDDDGYEIPWVFPNPFPL